jgi:hypothetical protein
MRSPSSGTASRSQSSPNNPTSASQGTSAPPACARASASTSPTVASSGATISHNHWRAGIANTTVQIFMY